MNIDEELKNCSDIGIGEYRKEEDEVEEPSTAVLSASENVHLAQIDTTGDDLTWLATWSWRRYSPVTSRTIRIRASGKDPGSEGYHRKSRDPAYHAYSAKLKDARESAEGYLKDLNIRAESLKIARKARTEAEEKSQALEGRCKVA